ncbi:hypothetical protein [Streptomyces sp. NPDC057094]
MSASMALVGQGAAYGSTWVRAFVTGLEALVMRQPGGTPAGVIAPVNVS